MRDILTITLLSNSFSLKKGIKLCLNKTVYIIYTTVLKKLIHPFLEMIDITCVAI